MTMKLSYPASHEPSKLTESLLSLKIARHSSCLACNACLGLRPPPGIDVVLDEPSHETLLGDLEQYGSDDDEEAPPYLDRCVCGHDPKSHGADPNDIGEEEFARRGRVAIRLDELLQDVGELLNFTFADRDIISVRRQMRIPASHSYTTASPPASVPLSPASSALSDPPGPATKKRRVSTSSLSDADDDDDEDEDEDRPLAARMTRHVPGSRGEKSARPILGRSGKTVPGSKSKKARTGPTSLAPPTDHQLAEMNGTAVPATKEPQIKVEALMDDGQLTRLATGVPIDTANNLRGSSEPPVKQEKAVHGELRRGVIHIIPIENDRQPRSTIVLSGLKTLFQKQLPKMPREYIARLVYDASSKALAIVKRGYKVVGGICYRPFPHRGFAEIVFFATNSIDQEKGYGGTLMDHFKAHVRQTYPDMMHFLTYADNSAVGYFEKQGFTKDITLDRSVWAGYIKDYEGGTIMQCTMVRKVDYLDKASIFAKQQEAVLTKIRELSRSHIVYPGLPQFQPGADPNVTVNPKDVPGLKESGWTPSMQANMRGAPRNADYYLMERLLKDLQGHPQGWPFLTPVNAEDVADYYEVIKNPMDFNTMEHKLETHQYRTVDDFVADAQLVFDNCRQYNPEGSIYSRNATKLEKYFREQLPNRPKKEE